MKPLIKICGINQLEILNELVLYNQINFLGFIFYEKSPRNVSFELLQEVKSFDFKNKRPVCVYVDADRSYIEETSSYFEDPILQFHGNESNEFCNSFEKDFWKVFRINNNTNFDKISHYPNASGILLENYERGKPGGTGVPFDWNLLNSVKDLDMKMILSGGINSENVDNAIDIKPWCLDINSGVESSPGVKSLDLVIEILNKL